MKKRSMTPEIMRTRVIRGMTLAHFRRMSGMTAEELVTRMQVRSAGAINFTSSAVYAWEKARNYLDDDMVLLVCESFGITVTEFNEFGSTLVIPAVGSEPPAGLPRPPKPTSKKIRGGKDFFEVCFTIRSGFNSIRERKWSVYTDAHNRIVVQNNSGTNPRSLQFMYDPDNGIPKAVTAQQHPINFNEVIMDAKEWQCFMDAIRIAEEGGPSSARIQIAEPLLTDDMRIIFKSPQRHAEPEPADAAPPADDDPLESIPLGGFRKKSG